MKQLSQREAQELHAIIDAAAATFAPDTLRMFGDGLRLLYDGGVRTALDELKGIRLD